MPLERNDEGIWSLTVLDDEQELAESSHPSYFEALPRYLTFLDTAFSGAHKASEFNFLFSLLAVRGMQDAGWDPYETTVDAINSIREVHNKLKGEVSRHLALWLYGHIIEASEPYELISNLINVSSGGQFKIDCFYQPKIKAPLSPGAKIEQLKKQAANAIMPKVVIPMDEVWNRELRNSIFHADYCLYGSEVRTNKPSRIYSHEQIMILVNRALAYHESISILRNMHIESYTEPKRIPAPTEFARFPGEEAVVIVRDNYGACGIKDGLSEAQLQAGQIPYRLGRFTSEECKLLDKNPTLARLPARA